MSTNGFFETRTGRVIDDVNLSNKILKIADLHPETLDATMSAYEWNEMGMAELFAEIYTDEARYCIEFKTWYTYYDGVWHKDVGAVMVSEKIKEFVRLMTIYCGEITDEEKRNAYIKFIAKLGDRSMRDKICKDAQGLLRINASELDANPYLINCKNGTYDLESGTFREASPLDFITQQTNFEHTVKRDVKCERWEEFIKEVTEGDKDKADFLQRALGYSLLGLANEECMFILYGKTTRNGKSTMLNTIEYLLGDYSKVAPVGLICKGDRRSDAEGASPTLAGLKAKRFVTMAESNEYGKLDEEKVKQYTGGEDISARELYQSAVTFKPQFTLWLSCNDLPDVTDKSVFASERIKVIEFTRHFSNEEQDKHLKEELITPDAMSGIFMWLVRGYKKYKADGLVMADHLRAVVKEYERANDTVLQFLESGYEKGESEIVRAVDLYKDFKTWARVEGMPIISSKRFNNEMERHSEWFSEKYMSGGYLTYKGIKKKEIL